MNTNAPLCSPSQKTRRPGCLLRFYLSAHVPQSYKEATHDPLRHHGTRPVCFCAWSVVAIFSPQAKQDDSYTSGGHLRKPSKHSGLPVVGEYEGQQESQEDRARRQIREKR